jgi:hypothetical protein
MSDQEFHGASARSTQGGEGATDWTKRTAKEAFASASTLAGETAEKVKQAASDTAASLTGEVKQLLDRQVGGGADMLGFAARSAKRAAEDLERDSPQMASLVRSLAGRMDGYADGLRDQSIDQLIRKASDFTRRQPALVFGLAALAGFFALRTVKSTPSIAAPSIQPSHSEFSGRGSEFHGA